MYTRICIFGRPGSGKSTFALKLSRATGLPLYHLDRYFFLPKWVERDYYEFLSDQYDIVNQDQWIIDGNAARSLEIRYERAQVCLYFNFSRGVCLYRLFKRVIFPNPALKDSPEGCSKNVRWNLIKYMWTFESRFNNFLKHKISYLRLMYPEVTFIEIRNNNDLKKLYDLLGI